MRGARIKVHVGLPVLEVGINLVAGDRNECDPADEGEEEDDGALEHDMTLSIKG